jgi:hypothetical protein
MSRKTGKAGQETDMTYFFAVSTALRLGFWLFVSGMVVGLVLGLWT